MLPCQSPQTSLASKFRFFNSNFAKLLLSVGAFLDSRWMLIRATPFRGLISPVEFLRRTVCETLENLKTQFLLRSASRAGFGRDGEGGLTRSSPPPPKTKIITPHYSGRRLYGYLRSERSNGKIWPMVTPLRAKFDPLAFKIFAKFSSYLRCTDAAYTSARRDWFISSS